MNQAGQEQPLNQPQPVQPQTTGESAVLPESELSPTTALPPETPKKSFPKIFIIVALLLVIILGGGAYAYFSSQRKEDSSRAEQAGTIAPSLVPTIALKTEYVGYQTITLTDVNGGTSSGTATRSIMPGYLFRYVQASLPDPPEGQFYHVWVRKPDGDYLSTGQRLSKGKDGSYSMVEGGKLDLSALYQFEDFSNIIAVSLETSDDGAIEKKILEGTFTQ